MRDRKNIIIIQRIAVFTIAILALTSSQLWLSLVGIFALILCFFVAIYARLKNLDTFDIKVTSAITVIYIFLYFIIKN